LGETKSETHQEASQVTLMTQSITTYTYIQQLNVCSVVTFLDANPEAFIWAVLLILIVCIATTGEDNE